MKEEGENKRERKKSMQAAQLLSEVRVFSSTQKIRDKIQNRR